MDALPKTVFENERFDVKKMEGILIKRKLPNSNFKIQIKENFEKITSINLYNVITVKQN